MGKKVNGGGKGVRVKDGIMGKGGKRVRIKGGKKGVRVKGGKRALTLTLFPPLTSPFPIILNLSSFFPLITSHFPHLQTLIHTPFTLINSSLFPNHNPYLFTHP
jgi:hypothetical protein